MEPTQYTLTSTSMFYTPGMLRWISALTKRDVKGAKSDKAARKHYIVAMFPTLPDAAVDAILRGDYVVSGEDVIVTI